MHDRIAINITSVHVLAGIAIGVALIAIAPCLQNPAAAAIVFAVTLWVALRLAGEDVGFEDLVQELRL